MSAAGAETTGGIAPLKNRARLVRAPSRCQLHAENLDDLFARHAAVGGRKYLKPQVL
jgi:hypothetical protein